MNAPAIARKDKSALLDALLEAGLIDEAGARRAAQVARGSNDSVVAVIHQLALADDTRVLEALAARFEIAIVAEADIPTTAVAVPGASATYLRRHRVLPLGWAGDRLLAGIIDPENSDGLAALAFAAGRATEPRLMTPSAQKRAFDALYGAGEADNAVDATAAPLSSWSDDAARMRDHADAAPAVRLVDAFLERAIDAGASDIHIEPMPDRVRIRFPGGRRAACGTGRTCPSRSAYRGADQDSRGYGCGRPSTPAGWPHEPCGAAGDPSTYAFPPSPRRMARPSHCVSCVVRPPCSIWRPWILNRHARAL